MRIRHFIALSALALGACTGAGPELVPAPGVTALPASSNSAMAEASGVRHKNEVDADHVPVPHFGIVLPPADFHKLAERLKSKGVRFVIEPKVRFAGETGEQSTMFFLDPSGNALEFKSFRLETTRDAVAQRMWGRDETPGLCIVGRMPAGAGPGSGNTVR